MISKRLAQVFFGGDYNPEQWEESVWQEDVGLMKRAGVNLVTLGTYAWGRLQPNPDTYEFGWLDRVLDLLHANGLHVNLSTGTASPPAWMTLRHPEMLPVNRSGVRLMAGVRQHHCPNSSLYADYSTHLVNALAARYAKHPAVVMWQAGGEHGSHSEGCYCDACAKAFRDWLRAKYKALEFLNAQWGVGFGGQWHQDWDEILPPRLASSSVDPALLLDYNRFLNDALLACFLNERRILKEASPELPVSTCFAGQRGLFKGVNRFQWAHYADYVTFGGSPEVFGADPADSAMALALQRGLGQGRPWVLMERSHTQDGRGASAGFRRQGKLRFWCLQALAHGADGVMFSQWRAARAGLAKFDAAMLPHQGSESHTFREMALIGQDFKNFAPVCGGRIAAEVALVVDYENAWAVEMDGCPARMNYLEIVRSYYHALFEPDIAIDLVQPEADLSSYKLVIAPALYLVREGVADNLERFVDRGGTLVVSYFSGLVDGNDRVIPGGMPGAFRKLLGIVIEEMESLPSGQTRHVKSHLRAAKCGFWLDHLRLETAEAVASHTEEPLAGHPAITRNAFGRGLAYYVGTHMEAAFMRSFFAELCGVSGIRPPLRVPEGVEAVSRINDQGRFLFLLNHKTTMQFADLSPLAGLDLLSGEHLVGQFVLKPQDGRVIQVQEPAEEAPPEEAAE